MAISKTQHVVVVGAVGAIGRLAVVDLLRKGHEVSAVVRHPGKFEDLDVTRELPTDQAQRLRIMQADARDAATLTTVITPKSIVVTAFGVSKRRSNGLFSEAAVAIVDAMRCGVAGQRASSLSRPRACAQTIMNSPRGIDFWSVPCSEMSTRTWRGWSRS